MHNFQLPAGKTVVAAFQLEPDSRRIYDESKEGTPLIGIADVVTGDVYLHPSALSFKKVDVTEADAKAKAVPGHKFSAADFAIVQGVPAVGEAAVPGAKKAFAKSGDTYFFTTTEYSATQIPAAALFDASNHVNYDDMDHYGFPKEKLATLKHGANGKPTDVQTVLYHALNGEIPQKKFLDHLNRNCALPVAQSTSHDCLRMMLFGDAEPAVHTTVGFAVHRHQDGYCTTAANLRVGPVPGMRFSGTSRSNNNRIFGKPKDIAKAPAAPKCEGCMSEEMASLIYNAITSEFDPHCQLPVSCQDQAAAAKAKPAAAAAVAPAVVPAAVHGHGAPAPGQAGTLTPTSL